MKKRFDFEYGTEHVEMKLPEQNRPIACFGAGTAGMMLPDLLPEGYSLVCYTDNNEKLWGTQLNGIEIMNPEKLKSIDNIFIIIVSQHALSIKKQLHEYGFQEGEDYLDVFSDNETYFRFGRIKHFEQFLERIDKQELECQTMNTSPRIGILLMSTMAVQVMCYQLAVYLILKSKGYNATLVLDFTGNYADIRYSEGDTDKLRRLFKSIIKGLEENFGEQSYVWVQENTDVQLSEEDKKAIEKNVRDSLISYIAYLGPRMDEKDIDREALTKWLHTYITAHYQTALKFLSEHPYDVLMEHNGVAGKRCTYMHLAHRFGMRVVCFDDVFWSSDYPSSWRYDWEKLYNGLSQQQKQDYVKMGSELFNQRMYGNTGEKGYIQLVEYDNTPNSRYACDVLIPLNIMFDSAVLGLDKVFESPEEWFVETVKFLYQETEAKVIIKESPHGPKTFTLNYGTYYDLVKPFIDNKRFIYMNREEQVNIYNLIENSKVILPYSSTIGIEAAIMEKPIITHTNCFYANKGFDIPCDTKEDYFNAILTCLQGQKTCDMDIDMAKIYFALIYSGACMNMSKFNECIDEWKDWSFQQLISIPEVNNIVQIIVDGNPWY